MVSFRVTRSVVVRRFGVPAAAGLAVPVLVLLAADAVLIWADRLLHDGVLENRRFSISRERSFGEIFQYFKALLLATLLLTTSPRSLGSVFWGLLFAVVFLDDAFALHEQAGLRLARTVPLPSLGSARPEQVGEAVLLVAAGLCVCAALVVVSMQGGPRSQNLTRTLLPGLALFAFFGIGVDLLHSMVGDPRWRYAVGLLEDGGEMVAATFLVGSAWAYSVLRDEAPP